MRYKEDLTELYGLVQEGLLSALEEPGKPISEIALLVHEKMGLKHSTAIGYISGFTNTSYYQFLPDNPGIARSRAGLRKLRRLSILLNEVEISEHDPVIKALRDWYEGFEYPLAETIKVQSGAKDEVDCPSLVQRIMELGPEDRKYVKWLIDSL